MQFRHPECPFNPTDYEQRGIDVFEDLLWFSSEICNGCFSRVRDVGPKVRYQLATSKNRPLAEKPPLTIEVNEWFERTELGSQEHTPWEDNKRFGSCYCTACGSDCTSADEIKSLDELQVLRENILSYITEHTSRTLDADAFETEVTKLKRDPAHQGWDDEILALAFSRALKRRNALRGTRVMGGDSVEASD